MRLLRPRICDDHSGPARGCGQDSGEIVGEVSSSWTLRNFPEIVNQLDKCRDLDLADSRFDRRSPNIVNSIGYTTSVSNAASDLEANRPVSFVNTRSAVNSREVTQPIRSKGDVALQRDSQRDIS